MIEELKRDAAKDHEALISMSSQVRRLQNQVKDLREKNQDLKHANKRYAGLLSNTASSSASPGGTIPPSAPTGTSRSSTVAPLADEPPAQQQQPQQPQLAESADLSPAQAGGAEAVAAGRGGKNSG